MRKAQANGDGFKQGKLRASEVKIIGYFYLGALEVVSTDSGAAAGGLLLAK